MKSLVLGFLVLLSLGADATYIPNDCPLKIASRCFTKVEMDRFYSNSLVAGGGVILTATVPTSNTRTGFHLEDATVFQVPVGTTLTCLAFRAALTAASSNTSDGVYLFYSDTTIVVGDPSDGTNPTYYGGGDKTLDATAIYWSAFMYTGNISENTLKWTVPAGKFPAITSANAPNNVTAFCLID